MKGQDEVHSRAKRQATKMGEVKTELISVSDTDSVGWGNLVPFQIQVPWVGEFVPFQIQVPWVGEFGSVSDTGSVGWDFGSVADADSGVLRLIFRYSYRKGFVNEHSERRTPNTSRSETRTDVAGLVPQWRAWRRNAESVLPS